LRHRYFFGFLVISLGAAFHSNPPQINEGISDSAAVDVQTKTQTAKLDPEGAAVDAGICNWSAEYANLTGTHTDSSQLSY